MDTISIRVLNKDIRKGIPGSRNSCPIAKSIRRQIKSHRRISVISANYIVIGSKRYCASEKIDFDNFIRNFDLNGNVKSRFFKLVYKGKY